MVKRLINNEGVEMPDYDYFFDIRTSAYDSNKVDIALRRCEIVTFMGYFPLRCVDTTETLHTTYAVEKNEGSIKLIVDDIKLKKSIYEKEMKDKIATEQFIKSVNGKSIKK